MAGVGVFLRRVGLLVSVMVFGVLASAGVASANSYTVNSPLDVALSPSTSTTCQTTTPGQCTLRAAVQAADNAGGASTITLPANTYTLTIASTAANDPSNGDLDVNNKDNGTSITINGAGSGTTTINPNHIDRAFAVHTSSTEGSLALSGVTIENGTTTSSSKSSVPGYGGAIYLCGALTLSGDVVLHANSADDYGGGIYQDDCDYPLAIRNSTVSNNVAGSDDAGGGVYSDAYATIEVTGSTFTSNNGGDGAGAIYDDDAPITLTYDHFEGNTAPHSGGYAGAVYAYGYYGFYLNHDEFDNNSAAEYGGAIYEYYGINANGSTFVGNRTTASTSYGGALWLYGYYPASLVNVTLSGNSSTQGGGVYFDISGPIDLINDTVFNNTATGGGGQGGGFYGTSNVTPYTVGVRNTIVAENSGGDCGDGSHVSQLYTGDAGYNLDSDSSCFGGTGAAGDKPGVNPLLAQPNDNGGPVLTDAEQSGSPAIDAGTDQNCPATDARGVARPQGYSCDMGAYETTAGTGQLSLSKTAPASAKVGKQFKYKLTVGNRGPGNSTGTTVADQLPANATLHGTSTSAGACSSSGSPAKVTCNLGTLVNGEGATVTITVSVGKTGTVTNTASVSNGQGSSASASAKTKITKGKLVLEAKRLKVKGGRVFVPFKCTGKKPCSGSFSIVAHPGTKRAVVCAKGSFKKIKAGKSRTVSAKVRKRCLSLLGKAKNHTLKAKLTATPKTAQQGVSAIVHLFLV